MKQRTWILIFAALAAACLLVWLLPGRQTKLAAVYQDGQLIAQLDPHKDTQLRVSGPAGENIITVSGGEIRVTKADCPDQLCVLHGPLAERGGQAPAQFAAAVRELLRDKLEAYAQKGQVGRVVRVMVLGIPNVGKSTFINKVARRKSAKAEDRPGVTRSKQWVPVDSTLELLDTPGILWPKFDDPEVGKRLAFTGAIKDDVLDIEELACYLMDYLAAHYADTLTERYKIGRASCRERV